MVALLKRVSMTGMKPVWSHALGSMMGRMMVPEKSETRVSEFASAAPKCAFGTAERLNFLEVETFQILAEFPGQIIPF